jgi:hypothetical protein
MKLTKSALLIILTSFLYSCGGDSDETTANATTPASVAPAAATTPAPESPVTTVTPAPVPLPVPEVITEVVEEVLPDPDAIYESTADLVVATSFLLEPEYQLAVSYNNAEKREVYLSICSDFAESDAGMKVDYNSCLLRTAIKENFSSTIAVANDKLSLVMAIWYFDDMNNPRFEVWENDGGDQSALKFEVN